MNKHSAKVAFVENCKEIVVGTGYGPLGEIVEVLTIEGFFKALESYEELMRQK